MSSGALGAYLLAAAALDLRNHDALPCCFAILFAATSRWRGERQRQ
jgi:hypothetical protein